MKFALRSLILAGATAVAMNSFAADDNASSVITLSLTPAIEIAQVDDVTITDPATGTNATGSDEFCVGGIGFGTFSIKFESNDGVNDTAFSLTDGTTTIPYSVGFDNSLAGTYTDVTEGTDITGLPRNAASCSGTDNARFEVTIDNADWENATVLDGTSYTDTLLITVTSE